MPEAVVAGLGKGKRPPVRVTLHEFTWRTTVAVYGGEYYIGLTRAVCGQAGVVFDVPVEVEVELDATAREVEVPAELAALLEREPGLKTAFERLSFTNRKEYASWIADARREQTRERRLGQAAEMLRTGVRTPR